MTQVHDRFQITCSMCGFLASEPKLHDALSSARRYALRHDSQQEAIEVYDSMAHYGKPELYSKTGVVITRREQESKTK